MKFLKIFFTVIVVSIGFIALQNNTSIVPKACATGWGSSCPDSPGATYHICPRTGAAYGGCVQSVDFNITIASDTFIPPGQRFIVSIFPTDGSGSVCSDVTCLKRTTEYTTDGWTGGSLTLPTLDQIGCSSGACSNAYSIRIRFAEPFQPGVPNCPISMNPDFTTTIQNGVPVYVPYTLHCQQPEATPTNSPTPSPTRTPTPTPTNVPGTTPTPTPTPPPGVTYTPVPTQMCPVPETPVVSVSCIGCNGGGSGSVPTPTTSQSNTSTPTPGVDDGKGPTIAPTSKPTPTPLPETNRKSGTACTEASQCASNVCGIRGKCV